MFFFFNRNTNTVVHSSLSWQSNQFHVLIHVSEGKNKKDSHPDNILHVKILQWCDVGVVTFVVLQDHLLDDTIQQQPVLHRVTAPLIYRDRNTEFPISLLAWAASPPACQKVVNEVGATVAV